VLYKPRGVVTTARDPHARRAAVDLVPAGARLFPVGRLDAASEGLLLLTNDGALAYVLTHPSFEVPRTYRVTVEGRMEEETLGRLRAGVEIGGRPSIPRTVEVLERGRASSLLEITLCEGRKRQIRETMRAVGHPVRRLLRTRFGPVRLGRLASGCWRRLRPSEERALRRLVSRVQVGARAPALRELSRRERSSARGR
jgi:23S rRNA pseudouridine2605 synthase